MLVALPFRTAKEAITIANNSMYGLAGSVWTENISLAMEVAISVKVRCFTSLIKYTYRNSVNDMSIATIMSVHGYFVISLTFVICQNQNFVKRLVDGHLSRLDMSINMSQF